MSYSIADLPRVTGLGPVPKHKNWATMTIEELAAEVEAVRGVTNTDPVTFSFGYGCDQIQVLVEDYKGKVRDWFEDYLSKLSYQFRDDDAVSNMHHIFHQHIFDANQQASAAINVLFREKRAEDKAESIQEKNEFNGMVKVRKTKLREEASEIRVEAQAAAQRQLFASDARIRKKKSLAAMKLKSEGDKLKQ